MSNRPLNIAHRLLPITYRAARASAAWACVFYLCLNFEFQVGIRRCVLRSRIEAGVPTRTRSDSILPSPTPHYTHHIAKDNSSLYFACVATHGVISVGVVFGASRLILQDDLWPLGFLRYNSRRGALRAAPTPSSIVKSNRRTPSSSSCSATTTFSTGEIFRCIKFYSF